MIVEKIERLDVERNLSQKSQICLWELYNCVCSLIWADDSHGYMDEIAYCLDILEVHFQQKALKVNKDNFAVFLGYLHDWNVFEASTFTPTHRLSLLW